MKFRSLLCLGVQVATLAVAFVSTAFVSTTAALGGEFLVADRLTNRVLRYSEGGAFLGVLIDDQVNLNQPAGITVSPDQSKLYVTSRLNNAVVEYNYTGDSATFSKSITSASAAPSTIDAPAAVLFSPDASKFYVSNLGAFANNTTVAQLNADGTSAGADLTGGPANGRSGLEWTPGGDLLASSYGFAPTGGVLRYDSGANSFVDFIPQSADLRGAANLLVNGDDLYLVAGFGGRVGRYDANTGTLDAGFATGGFITALAFPASIVLGEDSQSFLLSVLGAIDGTGRIDRYDLDGNLLGTFALNSNANPALGFREPTAIAYSTVVPEPVSGLIGSIAFVALGLVARGRRSALA